MAALRPATAFLVVLCAAIGVAPEAPAQERWQLSLSSSKILYELQPVDLAGDTLVILQEGARRRIPLAEISELRRIQPTMEVAGRGARPSIAALVGADDQVFQMTLLTLDEKRALVGEILRAYGPRGTARK
jgi:hypothetical protein